MICQNCGANNSEGAQFCINCGQDLYTDSVYSASQNGQNYVQENYIYQSQEIYIPQGRGGFVNEDEQIIASLKNGRIMNIISDEGFKNEKAFITNRRLYYNCSDGLINKRHIEKKIDIKDITGTKIEDNHPRMFLILAFIMFVIGFMVISVAEEAVFISAGAGVLFIILYFIRVKKHLYIDYAGGFVHFSVKNYTMENVREFQRCIHALKDVIQ